MTYLQSFDFVLQIFDKFLHLVAVEAPVDFLLGCARPLFFTLSARRLHVLLNGRYLALLFVQVLAHFYR